MGKFVKSHENIHKYSKIPEIFVPFLYNYTFAYFKQSLMKKEKEDMVDEKTEID